MTVTQRKKQEAPAPAVEKVYVPHLREFGLADLITLTNAACGMGCVFLCLNYLENDHYEGYLVYSFILLPIGLFCDIIDGWVARKRYSSPFGGDLDSLSDLISFGVAPASLGFSLGLRGIWDSIILTFFVLCGLSRLARYNVSCEIISAGTGKVKYYEGMPIPGSLLIVLLLYVCYTNGAIGNEEIFGGRYEIYPGHFHPFSLLYLGAGLMMLSTIHIPKP